MSSADSDYSSGASSSDDEHDDNIYYEEIEPLLRFLWRTRIQDEPEHLRQSKFREQLGHLYLAKHLWGQSYILQNLEE